MTQGGPSEVPVQPTARSALPPWLPFLVLAVAWVAHGRALQAGWVLDDEVVVRDSRVVTGGLSGVEAALGASWEGDQDAGTWRPLTLVSYCLDAAVWGGGGESSRAFGHHLSNLALHGLVALLLLLVVAATAGNRPWLAGGTALVFAVHPLHAATVTGLVGRADLLALLFSLLAVRSWIAARSGRPAFFTLAALCWLAALLAKEAALALPLVLLVIDAASPKATARRVVPGYALLVAPLVLYLLRWPGPTAPFPESLGSGIEGVGRMVLGFAIPVGLVEDRALVAAGPVLGVALGFGLVGPRRSILALALALTVAAALVGALVGPPGAPLDTRFAYVAGAGLFLLGGRAVESLLALGGEAPAWRRTVGVAGVGVLAVALAATTWHAEGRWRTNESWHRAVLERHPSAVPVRVRLARLLRQEAEADLFEAATLPAASPRRGTLLEAAEERLTEAHGVAGAASRSFDPGVRDLWAAHAYRELGFVLLERAEPAAAADALRAALQLDPWLASEAQAASVPRAHGRLVAETYARLGRAEESLGDPDAAAGHYRAALDFAPEDPEFLRLTARALVRARRYAEAQVLLKRARAWERDPKSRTEIDRELSLVGNAARDVANQRLQKALKAESEGENRSAVAAYESALAADPTHVQAWWSVARLRGIWLGDYRRAYAAIEAGLRHAENHEDPVERAAWVRRLTLLKGQLETQERQEDESEASQEGEED